MPTLRSRLFLHGANRSPASVQIIWRVDIADDDLDDRDRVAALLDVVTPRSTEAIEISLWAARAWLRADTATQIALSDIAERGPEEMGGRREDASSATPDRMTNGGPAECLPTNYGMAIWSLLRPNMAVRPMGLGAKLDKCGGGHGREAAMPYAACRFAARVTPRLTQQFLIDEQRENDQNATISIDLVRRNLRAMLAEHRDEAAPELLDAVLDLQYLSAGIRRRLELLKHSKSRRLERLFAYGYDIQKIVRVALSSSRCAG